MSSSVPPPRRRAAAITRREMQRVTPVAVAPGDALTSEAVVDLINHVLPSLGHRYLRKFMRHEGVRTLVLLLPEELVADEEADRAAAEGGADTSSGDDDDGDPPPSAINGKRAQQSAATIVVTDDAAVASIADHEEDVDDVEEEEEEEEEKEGSDDDDSSSDDEDGPPAPTGLDPAARALMKRRLAGAVCYEIGERLGERLIQVSLLGVRIRYQRLGVASRLVRALLSGEASIEKPEALSPVQTRAPSHF